MHDTDKILVFRRQKRVIKKGVSLQKSSRVNRTRIWFYNLRYNAIFFYAGQERVHHVNFCSPHQRGSATFSLPEYSENSGKCISIIPIDTYRDNSCTTSDRFVKPLDFRHFERFSGSTRVTGKHTKKQFLME